MSSAVAKHRPDFLLRLVALMILTAVWRLQEIVWVLGKLKFALLVCVMALGVWALDAHPARRFAHVWGPSMGMLLGMFGLMIAGIFVSILPGASVDFVTRDFGPTIALFVVAAATVRDRQDLRWLVGVFVAGGVMYSFHSAFFTGMDEHGRLDNLLYYDANDLALCIVCTMPLVLYLLRSRTGAGERWLGLLALAIMMFAFVLTGSRGGFLGIAAVALCALFAFPAIRAGTRVASIVLGLVALLALGGESYREKILSILRPEDDYNMTSETGRKQLWKNGIEIVAQRPLLGVGTRAMHMANGTLSSIARQRALNGDGIWWARTHNAYIEVAGEVGIPGVLLFLGMILHAVGSMFRLSRRLIARDGAASPLAALSRALAISLVAYLVAATFLSAEYLSILYLIVGLCVATAKVARLEDAAAAMAGPTAAMVHGGALPAGVPLFAPRPAPARPLTAGGVRVPPLLPL